MRLLIITQKIDWNDDILGFFTSWVGALARRSREVKVICLAKGSYDLPQNVEVVSLGKEKGRSKFIQAIIFFWYALRFLPVVDGVFVHMAPEYVRVLYPLNFFFKKPIVMWYAHISVSRTAKWALDHVSWVLTPSKDSFQYDSAKVIATGHGINTEMFAPCSVEPKAEISAISRISRVKKIETLIKAAKVLKDQGLMPTIDFYGKTAMKEDKRYFEELSQKVKDCGLTNFSWKGAIANRDMPVIYATHKIFVRMQGGGGFGKTELEAMSVGVPAIVPTDVYQDDLGDFAQDLFFREDDPEALADRIKWVLSWSKEKRAAYGELAREIVVRRHNVENVAEKIVSLLNK